MTETIKIDIDSDGIALCTIDVPGQSMNVINAKFQEELRAFVKQVAEDDKIKGAILTSGKDSFMAGADLRMLSGLATSGPPDPAQAFEASFTLNKLLREMETCGKPFVAAINGLALGGGFEIMLACHHRIVADDPKISLGLPEVQVGLLPGAGGTQRLPRLAGIQVALQYSSTGQFMKPQEALGLGIAQELAPREELIDRAKAWLNDKPTAVQPWDKKGFKIPGGGGAMNPAAVQIFVGANAMAQDKTFHNYPAVQAILSCVYEGTNVPIDTAIRIESKYFTKLILDPVARNMMRTLFVNKQAAEKGARRPKNVKEAMPTQKLGMLGAGMMGAGIAYVSARAGMDVVLLDTSIEAAEKGKAYSEKLVEKGVKRGKVSKEKGQALLDRIHCTTDFADLADCDLVIEAVFEDRGIKADVTGKTDAVIDKSAIFASNTSTLPITGLAEAFSRQDDFIGIHFFSPVDKMPLVEIIMGEKTGDKALAKALDYVRQIKKTPIVVNDSRGFYTSRCFGTYVVEGVNMLAEGINPALIENAGKMCGMPVGPLAVADEVSIELSYKVMAQTRKDLGDKYQPSAADAVVEKFVTDLGRLGRKSGKGYYDYPEGEKKHLWPGLAELYPHAEEQPSVDELKTRFLYRQAIEAARCYEEGVIDDPETGDLGAIFGWGFAPYTGGPLSMIDTIGAEEFVRTADRLAQAYGERFKVPQSLRDLAEKGESFYGRAGAKAAAE